MSTTIALPSWFDVAAFEAQLVPEVRGFPGPYGGPTEVVDLLCDRWLFRLTLPDGNFSHGAQLEALFNRLRGGADWLSLKHFARPVPAGTCYASTGLQANASQGASSIVLAGVRTEKNLLVYAMNFENAVWASSATVTVNTHASPFSASMVADTVTDDSVVVSEALIQNVTVPNDAASYTASIYVRKTTGATSPSFTLGLQFIGGASTIVNNPRVNTDSGAVLFGSATVTSEGDYWRVANTLTNDSTGHTTLRMTIYPAIAAHGLFTADPTVTGGCVISHAQVELGAAASNIEINPTLLAGDLVGLGGQLLMVASDAAPANGNMTVSIVNRLRSAQTAGAPITLQGPTAAFQLLSAGGVATSYAAGRSRGQQQVEFVEAWA